MANPLNLSRYELGVLRSLQSGFYAVPVGDPAWERLEGFGLVQTREAPNPPLELTRVGARYGRRRTQCSPS